MNAIDTDLLNRLGLTRQEEQQTKKNDQLGQGDFLKLMMAQLSNQDPFQPMESGEFLGQMAQFSTVSGINELQKSFTDFSKSIQSNQALQAASLVDRVVMLPAQSIAMDPEYGQMGAIDLPASSDQVTVTVHNEAGVLVRQIPLGSRPSGTAEFIWDGLTSEGQVAPPGSYSFRAQASGAAGQESPEVLLASRVGSVSVGQGQSGLVLHVQGLGEVDFSKVRRIG